MSESFQGQTYTPWGAVNQTIKARAGRVAKVLVNATVTAGNLTIYDNPSAASGPIVWVSPPAPASGTILPVDMPCQTGIFLQVPGTGNGIIIWS